jgi:hypothetical protein
VLSSFADGSELQWSIWMRNCKCRPIEDRKLSLIFCALVTFFLDGLLGSRELEKGALMGPPQGRDRGRSGWRLAAAAAISLSRARGRNGKRSQLLIAHRGQRVKFDHLE